MATISKNNIGTGNTIQAEHITRIIDALNGTGSADIIATGSFTGSFNGSADTWIVQDLTVNGTASINYFETIYETSSIIYQSGSTKFGNSADDTHQFTGSVFIEGNTEFNGAVTASSINLLRYYTEPTNDPEFGSPSFNDLGLGSTGSLAIGDGAVAPGRFSVVIGSEAGAAASSFGSSVNGDEQVWIGYQSAYSSSKLNVSSVAIGREAGAYYSASGTFAGENVLIGAKAGKSFIAPGTFDNQNVMVGYAAGEGGTGGETATYLGSWAGYQTKGSVQSTFVGAYAGQQANSSPYSVAVGLDSAFQAYSSSYATHIGYYAGFRLRQAAESVAIGVNSGYNTTNATGSIFIGSRAGSTAGGSNYAVALGYNALQFSTNSTYQVAVGYQAGYQADNQNYSIHIGTRAAYNSLSNLGDNNIILGNNLSLPTNASQSLNIGGVIYGTGLSVGNSAGSATATPTANGRIGIGKSSPNSTLDVNGNTTITGSLKVTTSVTASSYTGSFVGDGAGLYNIPSSGITGLNLSQIASGSATASIAPNTGFRVNTDSAFTGSMTISGSTSPALNVIGSGSAVFTVNGSVGEIFSVSDSLSGSLFAVNNSSGFAILDVDSDNTIKYGDPDTKAVTTTVKNTVNAVGAFTVYSLATASYDGAWFEYVAKSGSDARAGQIMSLWSDTSVNFTETTTTDFGNTSGLSFTVAVTGSNFALTGSVATAGWTIKTIVRSI